MFRIDEIYNNIFVQALQHRQDIALHWFDPFGSTNIQDMCNIPPRSHARNRIVFWDQEPLRPDDIDRFMHEFLPRYHGPITMVCSEKDSESIRWLENKWSVNTEYYFFHGWAALDWYRGYNFTYLCKPWQQRQLTHAFFCPNNIIGGERQHRVELFGHIMQRGLVDNNVISFPDRCPHESVLAHDLLKQHGFDLRVDLPRVIDGAANHANQSHAIQFWSQAENCFAHIVTETLYHGDRLHLTEKTFKPIVMQQPFLLVAPRRSLAYLRSYGFETFGSIWDEGYDDLDDDARIAAIADIAAEINAWTPKQRWLRQQDIAKVVNHNHHWFYHEFAYGLWRETRQLLERLHAIPVF